MKAQRVKNETVSEYVHRHMARMMLGMTGPMYAVRRCRSASNDDRYGPIHMSESGAVTLCGREVDAGWWIENQTGDGADCKTCLAKRAISEAKQ